MAASFRISRGMLLLLHVVLLPGVARCSSLFAAQREDPPEDNGEEVGVLPEKEDPERTLASGSNCSRCSENRERRELRLQSIKSQILSQLGLLEAPNITDRSLPHIPPLDHLLDRYSMQADAPHFVPGPEYGEEDDFYISAEKMLSFAHTPPTLIDMDKGDQQLYFKLSSNLQNSQIQTAHLWIYLKPKRHTPHRNITLYQISRQHEFGHLDLLQLKRKSLEKKNRHGHWIVFEVKKAVNHWMKHPKENLGFVLHSSGSDMAELIGASEHNQGNTKPFVEIKVEKQKHRRTRRMIGLNCEENADEVRCCRYPLTVDFEEFGWDWIIAPKRYEANYCSGECPYVFLQKYPHTHLVQQANPQGSAGPCCAPRKMSSISMLYFDADFNIIYGMLPGMVVDRCGCS